MASLLGYSMFRYALFPPYGQAADGNVRRQSLRLRRTMRFHPPHETLLTSVPVTVFDFETTGLDSSMDRIVEIGALRFDSIREHGAPGRQEFTTLVRPDVEMTLDATRVSGITDAMLQDAPTLDEALPKFLAFAQGSVLFAHNADFDWSFLKSAADRMEIDLQWPVFCTLKMARALLPQLESRSLDALAAHYGLSFTSRHRALGDVEVTAAVLHRFAGGEATGTPTSPLVLNTSFEQYRAK